MSIHVHTQRKTCCIVKNNDAMKKNMKGNNMHNLKDLVKCIQTQISIS
jgi:hypothetical protein